MGWRVGCIKLPYSKLSRVTEPRGWSLCCFHRGKKDGKEEEDVALSLSVMTISTSSFGQPFFCFCRSFSSGLIQPAGEGGMWQSLAEGIALRLN